MDDAREIMYGMNPDGSNCQACGEPLVDGGVFIQWEGWHHKDCAPKTPLEALAQRIEALETTPDYSDELLAARVGALEQYNKVRPVLLMPEPTLSQEDVERLKEAVNHAIATAETDEDARTAAEVVSFLWHELRAMRQILGD